jgi:hypothetical protein
MPAVSTRQDASQQWLRCGLLSSQKSFCDAYRLYCQGLGLKYRNPIAAAAALELSRPAANQQASKEG